MATGGGGVEFSALAHEARRVHSSVLQHDVIPAAHLYTHYVCLSFSADFSPYQGTVSHTHTHTHTHVTEASVQLLSKASHGRVEVDTFNFLCW